MTDMTDMTDRPFHPKLVRTELYDWARIAQYALCGRDHKPLAGLALPVPTTNLETLKPWEDQLRTHVEFCWQLAFNDTETAMDILSTTLDQLPGLRQSCEPRLTYVDFVRTRPDSERTIINPPIPHLHLPGSDW